MLPFVEAVAHSFAVVAEAAHCTFVVPPPFVVTLNLLAVYPADIGPQQATGMLRQ